VKTDLMRHEPRHFRRRQRGLFEPRMIALCKQSSGVSSAAAENVAGDCILEAEQMLFDSGRFFFFSLKP
jgi:hypothetical protein